VYLVLACRVLELPVVDEQVEEALELVLRPVVAAVGPRGGNKHLEHVVDALQRERLQVGQHAQHVLKKEKRRTGEDNRI